VGRDATNRSAVAHKSKENQRGQESGLVPEGFSQDDEFENAVTTEISDVLASAFGEDSETEPNDVHITDMQLTARVDFAADDILSPGFLLNDRFEIVELVHSGGMSLVYKAVDRRRRPEGSGEIHVAIKMMRPSIASDEEARLSLEREAAKVQSLSHPNIINIFDFDAHEGRFFLVMEWLEGESVNTLLRRTVGEKIEPDLAWKVIEGAAAGVQHAHQKNVVHADINPSNIFITQDQEIKLLDFGVARYTRNQDLPEDDRFTWVTKPYASPEVLLGLTPVFEDDVFSLACVAYRLLGGKQPFGDKLSLVAKHQKFQVGPIPGLPDNEWQVLQRALAYERSVRPGSVNELLARHTGIADHEKTLNRKAAHLSSLLWMSVVAVAALVIGAGGFWFLQRATDGETTLPAAPAATDTPAISVTEALVAAANGALGEGQLVLPDERNARTLFREALALEPENVEALRGLRTISNNFVQQAQLALNADDPLRAYTALAVAAETDPANPAIEIVEQLLVAKGSGEIADARLAAATGNFDLAAQQLARAEQYTSTDPAAVQSIRRQIAQGRQNDQLLVGLAMADVRITEGRLLGPEGDNAHALLLELYGQHGDDARLRASMERLRERLLTRAAFAAAAGRVADASELLDAVAALGMLAPEVEAARISLETIETGTEPEVVEAPQVAEEETDVGSELTEELPAPQIVDQGMDAAPLSEEVQAPEIAEEAMVVPLAMEDVQLPPVEEEQTDDALLAAVVGEQVVAEEPDTQAAPTSEEPEIHRLSLQELGISEYVAPEFPGYAERRGVSGVVEIGFTINADGSTDAVEVVNSRPGRLFAKSATEAVRQWRFEPRNEALKAQVTLRFDYAP